MMDIEQHLYELAAALIEKRYPTGWGGAAAVHTASGNDYLSIALSTPNAGAELCIETGAMCEAHKFGERITHCICVVREDENAPFRVLSPCGICQERLLYWGKRVRVGVTTKDNTLKYVALSELNPYHWTDAYSPEELEHYSEDEL